MLATLVRLFIIDSYDCGFFLTQTLTIINDLINWDDFSKVDIRVGTILSVEVFKEVKIPAFKLQIDFGDLGIKKSSAQLTTLYKPENLIGKQVIAVVNFPPKQIATMMSECLVLGAVGNDGEITLVHTEQTTKNGLRIG